MLRAIKPWRLGRVVRHAKCAVELPEGDDSLKSTEVGDKAPGELKLKSRIGEKHAEI